MKKSTVGAFISGFVLLGCNTITEQLPSQPSQNPPGPTLSIPLPVFSIPGVTPTPTPAPKPTPTPLPGPGPTPTPAPGPTPTPTPEPAGPCSNPTPGPLAKIDVTIHIYGANRLILDSTPLVGPDAAYCLKIGFTDGRRYCPPRPEGHNERYACDGMLMGEADDTGRTGPTWFVNHKACVIENGCENHPDNQFLSFAYTKGLFEACAHSGLCGSLVIN